MKTLLKLLFLTIVLSIFAFSENPTITDVRNFTLKTGKNVYGKTMGKMSTSKYAFVAKTGDFLK
jgi:hypothetical protein